MHVSEPSELLVANLPLIDRIAAAICRRKGMPPEEVEEFLAILRLRLVDDDYAVIRAFRNRSSLATFITTVASRLLLDYQKQQWGRWRASAEAMRMGDAAVELERLLYRDGLPLDTALETIRAKFPDTPSAQIESFVQLLPPRVTRQRVALDVAAAVGLEPDVSAFEQRRTGTVISAAVNEYIEQLPSEDRLLLQLRFESDMTVAQIARALQQDQAVLYRRLYRCLDGLRRHLERAGIHAQDVHDIVGNDAVVLDFRLRDRAEREPATAMRREP